MEFAHPEILWALLALTVPIIVHLFNFRRYKRVDFSNVAFLKEVQQETKSRSKLKHLLILASRLLAIAFIVLAFAQPYIPLDSTQKSSNERLISVYIDNSFSMDAESGEGRLIDLAKAKAAEVVGAYQATDRFQLITNDMEGRHQRLHSQEDVLEMIDQVQVSPAVREVDEVIERQQDLLIAENTNGGSASIYHFSDLQKSTHKLDGFVPDSSISIRFIPEFAARAANIWVDSVWFDTPVRQLGQPEKLNLRIKNSASEGFDNIPMRLEINGSQKSIGSFNVIPGTHTDTSLVFTIDQPGLQNCKVSIQDHPIAYDDDWYFGYTIAPQSKVLLIKGNTNGNAFRSIFSNDPFYALTETDVRNVNYGALSSYDLIILDQLAEISSGLTAELNIFFDQGGTVLLIPDAGADRNSYNELLASGGAPLLRNRMSISTKVNDINLEHPIYDGVFDRIPENIDLPKVNSYFSFDRGARTATEVLLTLQNGDPFFMRSQRSDGQLFTCAVSLAPSESNFAQHAIFVPTVLRVAEFARTGGKLNYTVGNNDVVRLRRLPLTGDLTFTVKEAKTGESFIPRHRAVRGGVEVFLGDELKNSGNYELLLADTAIMALGLNYSREESELKAWSKNEWEGELGVAGWTRSAVIESKIDTVSSYVEQLDEGKVLWDLFIMLALAMLIVELLLIKFWRS